MIYYRKWNNAGRTRKSLHFKLIAFADVRRIRVAGNWVALTRFIHFAWGAWGLFLVTVEFPN